MRWLVNTLVDTGRLIKHLTGAVCKRKAWWLVPMLIVLLLVIVLVVVAESPLAPFIYTLF
jgi:hypothetical protein